MKIFDTVNINFNSKSFLLKKIWKKTFSKKRLYKGEYTKYFQDEVQQHFNQTL